MASGPLLAIFAATSRTFGRSSACGTTALTRPMRSASSAPMHVARHAELARARVAHAAREALRAAEAGDDAEVHLGLAELRLVARVDEVARERELAPAAEREAVDGGDDGEVRSPRARAPMR